MNKFRLVAIAIAITIAILQVGYSVPAFASQSPLHTNSSYHMKDMKGNCEYWRWLVGELRRRLQVLDHSPIRETGLSPVLMDPGNIGSVSFVVGAGALEYLEGILGFQIPLSAKQELGPHPNGEEWYRVTFYQSDFCDGPPPSAPADAVDEAMQLLRMWVAEWFPEDLTEKSAANSPTMPVLITLVAFGLIVATAVMLVLRPRWRLA